MITQRPNSDRNPNLKKLAEEANRCAKLVQDCLQTAQESACHALEYAVQCGEALNKAKKQVAHGQWTRWLKENFAGSHSTANHYAKIAKEWPDYLSVIKARRQAKGKGLSINDALEFIQVKRPRNSKVKNPIPEEQTLSKEVIEAIRDGLHDWLPCERQFFDQVIVQETQNWLERCHALVAPIAMECLRIKKQLEDSRAKRFSDSPPIDGDPRYRTLIQEHDSALEEFAASHSLSAEQKQIVLALRIGNSERKASEAA